MSHVHTLFIFSFYGLRLCFYSVFSLSLSLSLSLFWIEPLYVTQTEKIHSGSEPSSRFRVIHFVSSFCSISHLVLWWEGQDGLLWELPGQWCKFRTPGHSIGFLRHYVTWCHLDSGMGISMWETRALSSVPQFATRFRGTRIVVTLDLVAEVLRVLRVALPDYLGCDCLWTMSRDKLISHFCGTPSIWGGKLNTPCSGFVKGLRFLNMVMTFALTPLSHYNSITELCAYFLLSLMEGLTIDFPSHFITSIIDVY